MSDNLNNTAAEAETETATQDDAAANAQPGGSEATEATEATEGDASTGIATQGEEEGE